MELLRLLGALPSMTALFDPGWWDVMRDSTTSGHFSPEATILMVGIFVLAGLSIAAGLLLKVHWHREEPVMVARIVKLAEIRALLETALTQRSKMRVSFVRDDPGTRTTDATILSADRARGIELEMTSLVNASQTWIGKLVACDFSLRLDPRRDFQNFYAFVSPVRAIAKAGDNFVHMTVNWPEHLDLEQKRAFLRVEPSRNLVLDVGLWPEALVRQGKGRFSDPESWGDPIVRWDARLAPPPLELRNLSGGGLRLDIQAEAIHRHLSLFELGSRFLLHVRLDDAENGEPLDCFLAARLQNSYGDPDASGHKAFGFRLLSFAVPEPDDERNLTWKTAAAGVPVLDDWAFRRHLEAYRARGV